MCGLCFHMFTTCMCLLHMFLFLHHVSLENVPKSEQWMSLHTFLYYKFGWKFYSESHLKSLKSDMSTVAGTLKLLQNIKWTKLFCSSRNFLGTKETSLLLMAMFLLAVFYHGQQVRAFFRPHAKSETDQMVNHRKMRSGGSYCPSVSTHNLSCVMEIWWPSFVNLEHLSCSRHHRCKFVEVWPWNDFNR